MRSMGVPNIIHHEGRGFKLYKNQPGDVISLLVLLLIKFLAITTQNKLQDITRCEMG